MTTADASVAVDATAAADVAVTASVAMSAGVAITAGIAVTAGGAMAAVVVLTAGVATAVGAVATADIVATVATQLVKVICRNGADLGWALGRAAIGGVIGVAPTFSCVVAFFVDVTFGCDVNWKCNSDVCRFPSWGEFGVPAMGELDPVEPLAELTGDDDEEVGGASLDRTGLLVLLAPRTLILDACGVEEASFLSLHRMKSSSDVCRFRTSTASAFWVFAFTAI
jgi:hypothetical protein